MKTCKQCGAKRARSEFYRHPKTSDGLLGVCKECHKANVRRNRAEKVEYYRGFDRMRYKLNPSIRKRITRVAAEWAVKNPEKRKASHMVNNAVRDGRLEKPSVCADCGQKHRVIHGHHEDYSKPLDVIWVCPPCHRARHLKDD